MIELEGGKLWQWDTGRLVRVVPPEGVSVIDVQFCNGTTDTAPCGKIHQQEDGSVLAEIPNSFLQEADPLSVFAVKDDPTGKCTTEKVIFIVHARPRPDGYVFTEDEVKTWDEFDRRIQQLEGEGLSKAVADYLKENPPSGLPPITEHSEGMYLTIKNGVAVWDKMTVPEQYGLVTYTQDKTISIT